MAEIDVENLDLKCMNCKGPTNPKEPKLYGRVWVCLTCYKTAQLFEKRLDDELTRLRKVAHNAVEQALSKGELHLSTAHVDEIPKQELLTELLRLVKDGSPR